MLTEDIATLPLALFPQTMGIVYLLPLPPSSYVHVHVQAGEELLQIKHKQQQRERTS